ncbi:MAG: hypothetical protein AAF901_04420, partial [Bacteroidota bacterium]
MKKIVLFLALTVIITVNSQNTFPASGNVGIGTISPTESLQVDGNILTDKLIVDASGEYRLLQVGSLIDGFNRNFNFMKNSPEDQVRFAMYNSLGNIIFDLNNSQVASYMTMKSRTGTEIFKFSRVSSLGSFLHMPFTDSRIVIGGYGDYLHSDGHKFVVKNGSAMIEGNILTNNNVGIGTSSFVDGSDTYRLSVNGKVRAEAVKVYTGWADYVFENDYKLPTLEEVEAFIKQNGHLKDIPSAKEVEANGIDLGEMNKLLLQKIEELTLYIIELKKEVDILKSKIGEDENEN